jgi:hypothetical protein
MPRSAPGNVPHLYTVWTNGGYRTSLLKVHSFYGLHNRMESDEQIL